MRGGISTRGLPGKRSVFLPLPHMCAHPRIRSCPRVWRARQGPALLLFAVLVLMLVHTKPTAGLHLRLQALSWTSDLHGNTGRSRHLRDESFVAYVAQVSVGTPPQSKRLIVDTGSSALAMTPYTGSKTLNVTSIRDSIQYDKGSWEGVLSEDIVQLGRARAHARFSTITASADLFHDVGAHDGIWGLLYNPRRAKQYPLVAYGDEDTTNGSAASAPEAHACGQPALKGADAHHAAAKGGGGGGGREGGGGGGTRRPKVPRGTDPRTSRRRKETARSEGEDLKRRLGAVLKHSADQSESMANSAPPKCRRQRDTRSLRTPQPPPVKVPPARTPNFAIALCGGQGDLWLDTDRTHIAHRDWTRAGADMSYMKLVDDGIYLAVRFTGISVLSATAPVTMAHPAQPSQDSSRDHHSHQQQRDTRPRATVGTHAARGTPVPKHAQHGLPMRGPLGNVEVDTVWMSAGSGARGGNRMSAIFDTGTTFLLLPEQLLQRVLATLKHHFHLHGMSIPQGVWDGYCAALDPTQWPPLVLHLKGKSITVSGHQYLNQQGEGVFCLGLGASSSSRRVILGATVLQGLLLHFDVEHRRVGIAHQTPVAVGGAQQQGTGMGGNPARALASTPAYQRKRSEGRRRARRLRRKKKGRGSRQRTGSSSSSSSSRLRQGKHAVGLAKKGRGQGMELAWAPGSRNEAEAVYRFGASLLNRPANEMLQRMRAQALAAGRVDGDWRTCMPTPQTWQAQLPPATTVDHLCNLLAAGTRDHVGTGRMYRALCAASCSDCSRAGRSWCISPTVEVWISGHRSVIKMDGAATRVRGLCWQLSALGALGIRQADPVPLVFLPGHGWASLRLECAAKAMYHAQCVVSATVSRPLCMVAAWLGTFAVLLAAYELLCMCHHISLRWQGHDGSDMREEEGEEREQVGPGLFKDRRRSQRHTAPQQGPAGHARGLGACLQEDSAHCLYQAGSEGAQREHLQGLHHLNAATGWGLSRAGSSAHADLTSPRTKGVSCPAERQQHGEEATDTVADAVVVLGLG